ncbi:hypothetical protein KY289_005055 [Solanum tuberosum]|nr:hypothetical protein KY289_005052 [Solanum tuberosum]KAH0722011.1 hypothetical protein KY289_005055 [Solanum tuberosum]
MREDERTAATSSPARQRSSVQQLHEDGGLPLVSPVSEDGRQAPTKASSSSAQSSASFPLSLIFLAPARCNSCNQQLDKASSRRKSPGRRLCSFSGGQQVDETSSSLL